MAGLLAPPNNNPPRTANSRFSVKVSTCVAPDVTDDTSEPGLTIPCEHDSTASVNCAFSAAAAATLLEYLRQPPVAITTTTTTTAQNNDDALRVRVYSQRLPHARTHQQARVRANPSSRREFAATTHVTATVVDCALAGNAATTLLPMVPLATDDDSVNMSAFSSSLRAEAWCLVVANTSVPAMPCCIMLTPCASSTVMPAKPRAEWYLQNTPHTHPRRIGK